MIKKFLNKFTKPPGNQGFSLIELIISIVILVLIMLPLMNSFYRSALLNRKAKDTQVESNLASNIMEGLRDLNLNDTIQEFNGSKVFDIISMNNSATPRVLSQQNPYCFAIDGLIVDGSAYDALITMNTQPYKVSTIMNNYQMPDAINLDVTANGILYSDGRTTEDVSAGNAATLDNDAFTKFKNSGYAYFTSTATYKAANDSYQNACEDAKMKGLTAPALPSAIDPNYVDNKKFCDDATIKDGITKTMNVTIDQEVVGGNQQNKITYEINYQVGIWPPDASLISTLTYNISEIYYESTIENIYIIYLRSCFKNEVININNVNSGYPLNFFLDKQVTTTPDSNIAININNSSVSFFTNMDTSKILLKVNSVPSSAISNIIVNKEQKDRILNTEVDICSHTDNAADKYKDVVYKVTSATENSD